MFECIGPDQVPAQAGNETARLDALRALSILDTPAEAVFDEAARMAAAICGTPLAAVNLIDENRQWFKASIGFATTEVPREHAICNYALGRTEMLTIPDLAADPRFRANPFVTGELGLRFYAGMPLNTPEGHTVGTLCVADTVPQVLSTEQCLALSMLGHQVATQMELRAKLQLLHEAIEQKEYAERRLRQRNQLFSAFMEHSPAIGFIKDADGRFLYYNRMFCERFAVSRAEWLGKSVFDMFPEEFAAAYHELDMRVLREGVDEVVEESSPGPGGTTLYWRTHKFRLQAEDGAPLLGGMSLDISHEREATLRLQASHGELERANRRLSELAVTDGLTGLSNRRAFDEQLARLLNTSLEAGTPLSLLLLDVDHFKRLNDTHGHAAGDDVLRSLAQLLAKASRSSDYVARVGGEEFAILLPGAGMRAARRIAERRRAPRAGHGWTHGALTVSGGGAARSAMLSTPATLMEAADAALYGAKHAGRNRVGTEGSSWLPAQASADGTTGEANSSEAEHAAKAA